MSLKITITGYPGEGKTTLAYEISSLLAALKMIVVVNDLDLEEPRPYDLHEGCLHAMQDRDVTIETIQIRKIK